MFERVKTALILLVIVLFCIFAKPQPYLMWFLISALVAIASYEWFRLLPRSELVDQPIHYGYVGLNVVLLWLVLFIQSQWLWVALWLICTSLFSYSCLLMKKYPAESNWYLQKTLSISGVFLFLATATAVYFLWNISPWWLMYLFFLVWGADSGAYLVGRKFGVRKLAPHVSPNKSIEGLIGGLITAMLIMLVVIMFNYSSLDFNALQWCLFAVLSLATSLASVQGDLFESMLKRRAGIKDSGHILPGHGGVLDRIDSLTAATPLFALGYLLISIL